MQMSDTVFIFYLVSFVNELQQMKCIWQWKELIQASFLFV